MPKKSAKKVLKNPPKEKPWWDESRLTKTIDEKGRTVSTLFPSVVAVKNVVSGEISSPSTNVRRQVQFVPFKTGVRSVPVDTLFKTTSDIFENKK